MTSRLLTIVCCLCATATTADDKPRPKSFSPFTPGVQNQSQPSGGTHRNFQQGPFNPGTQNNSSRWDAGQSWGGNSGWNQGGWNQSGQWSGGGVPPGATWSHPQPQPFRGSVPSGSRIVAPPAPVVSFSGRPITVTMPMDQSGVCEYTLAAGAEEWAYSIGPGKTQTFIEDRTWRITYDRGNGLGRQSYRLEPGVYRFRHSSQGWGLYRAAELSSGTSSAAPPPPR